MSLSNIEAHFSPTDREREALALVARGFSDREIAAVLVLSRDAVHSRIQRFAEKTGLHGTRRLASWCGKHEHCCIVHTA